MAFQCWQHGNVFRPTRRLLRSNDVVKRSHTHLSTSDDDDGGVPDKVVVTAGPGRHERQVEVTVSTG